MERTDFMGLASLIYLSQHPIMAENIPHSVRQRLANLGLWDPNKLEITDEGHKTIARAHICQTTDLNKVILQ